MQLIESLFFLSENPVSVGFRDNRFPVVVIKISGIPRI